MKKSTLIFSFFISLFFAQSCKKQEILKNSEKKIIGFKLNGISNVISTNIDDKTINIVLPPLSNPNALIPTIDISLKASISPASGVVQNFTSPVIYTVTAEDGTTQIYTVTVQVQKSVAKDILSFKITDYSPASEGKIDGLNKKIIISVPNKQKIKTLTPEITVSERAKISPTGVQDFTNSVTYTVTAEDGTTQTYSVSVLSAEKTMKIFILSANPQINGTINENTKEITATVTNALSDAFSPIFDVADAAKAAPVSKTAQDFKNPVKYTITAEDGTTQIYTVTITFKETVSTGLLAYYPFNGNSSDISGNNNNAVNAGAILAPDKDNVPNKAYYFDGDSYMAINNISNFLTPTYTYSTWVKAKSIPGDPGAGMIISIGGPTGDQALYLSNATVSNTAPGSWYSHTYNSAGNNGVSGINGLPSNFKLDQWYHLCVIRTPSTMKFYINGNLITSISNIAVPFYGNGSYYRGLIGGRFNYGQYFNGYIDDVRIYNRTLTEEELKYLYLRKL